MNKFSLLRKGLLFTTLSLMIHSANAEHNTFIAGTDMNNLSTPGDIYFRVVPEILNTQGSDYIAILPHASGSNPTQVPELAKVKLGVLSSNISLICRNGGSRDNVRLNTNRTNPSLTDASKTNYTGVDSEPLLKTTIPGLFVSIGLSEPAINNDTSFFSSGGTQYFPFSGANPVIWPFVENRGCRLIKRIMGKFTFKTTVRFYVNNQYNPAPNQQMHGGTYIASMYSDESDGSAEVKVKFQMGGFTVSAPTCTISTVTSPSAALTDNDGTGTNYNLDLGNYYPSDIKNGRTQKVPFKIKLQGCLGTPVLRVDVAGTTTPDGKLFANTLENQQTGAGNVAVKLQNSNGSSVTDLYPGVSIQYTNGGISRAGFMNRYTGAMSSGSSGEYNMDFNAQLVPADASKPIKPGAVGGRTTFILNYP